MFHLENYTITFKIQEYIEEYNLVDKTYLCCF